MVLCFSTCFFRVMLISSGLLCFGVNRVLAVGESRDWSALHFAPNLVRRQVLKLFVYIFIKMF